MLEYFLRPSIIDIIHDFLENNVEIVKYLGSGAHGVVFKGILNKNTKVAIKFTYNNRECHIFDKISSYNLPIFIRLYICEEISLDKMNKLIENKSEIDVYDTLSQEIEYKRNLLNRRDINMIVMEYVRPLKSENYTSKDIFQIYFNIVYALLNGIRPFDVNQYNIAIKKNPITLIVCDRKMTLSRQLVLIDYAAYHIDKIGEDRLDNRLISVEFEGYADITNKAKEMIDYITDRSRDYENVITILYNLIGMIDSSSRGDAKLVLAINSEEYCRDLGEPKLVLDPNKIHYQLSDQMLNVLDPYPDNSLKRFLVAYISTVKNPNYKKIIDYHKKALQLWNKASNLEKALYK